MGCGSSKKDEVNLPTKGGHHHHKNNSKPEVIFVLGGPGSGKGTQCSKLKQDFGFIHLSTGDLLRAEREKGGEDAKEIEGLMNEGKLVSSAMLVKLVQKEFQSNGNMGRYLLDGFPRSQDNLDAWNATMKDSVDVKFLLYIECTFEVMEQRIVKRSETSGRSDDNIETVKKRFETFTQETEPLVKLYDTLQKSVQVDASKSVDEVYSKIIAALDQKGVKKQTRPSVIFVLGGPGSGKGTQCTQLKNDFSFIHLSTGDLLRDEQKQGGPNAEMINNYIKEGKLVPSELLVRLVRKEFLKNDMQGRYLIDGFPRNQENLTAWSDMMTHLIDFKFLLYFQCSFEVMNERLISRGKSSGRADDNPETIKKRFDTFTTETEPIVKHYQEQSLAITLNSDQLIGKVYSELKKEIKIRVLDQINKKEDKPPKKQYVTFVLGGPGSGKGTQCANILKKYPEFCHLSTGDLLRDELTTKSKDAKMIEDFMKEGKLVPSELLVKLIQKKIYAQKNIRKFLLDGFPRSEENLNAWYSVIGQDIKIKKLLFFDIPLDIMEQRLLKRAETSGRPDDNPETIKKRLDTYQHETLPMMDKFHKSSQILKVDAQGSIDDVFLAAETILKEAKIIV